MSYIYSMVDLWNEGGTTFKGIQINVTNTSSAAASRVMDLQVGGVSQFQVAPNGQQFGVLGTALLPSISFIGDPNTGFWSPAADTLAWSTAGAETMRITSTGNVGIGTTSPGTKLEVAGVIRTSGGSVPAAANNTAMNYVAGSTGQIVVHGPDNSTPGAFQIIGLSANDSAGDIRLAVGATGHITPGVDNTQNFGSGSFRWATIFAGGVTISSAAAMLTSSVGMNDGAAAAAGTLLNAPAAGNPTKWIPFNDNGTTRYIPAW